MLDGKILLVDDDPSLLRVVSFRLIDQGYQVIPVGSARAALQIVKKEAIDLVITDLQMPEMNGRELLEELRKLDSSLPVIILSGHGTTDTAAEMSRKGAFAFLNKLFQQAELEQAVDEALEMSRANRES